MKSSPKHSRRGWLPHATWAIVLALLVVLGGAAPEFFSEEFKRKYAPADKWILVVIIIAGLAAVIEAARAVFAARDRNENNPSPHQAGFYVGDHNQGAFSFQGGNVTAANTQGDVIGRDKITHIYNALPSEPDRKHQLPPPPPDFTGRERELNDLLAKLNQGVTISGLRGLGGVGKTALALKLAERIKDRYPDAQIYLDMQGAGDNPLTPAKAMEHVIRAYHPTARLPESLSELSAIYRTSLHGQRALLLMDNARNREQVEALVPPADCVLLVTSRQHFILPGMFDQNLDRLPREDAINLLLNIAGRVGNHADEIARLCGNLPLALRLAASALAERPNLPPADYARQLADAKQRLSHLKEVDVTLQVSYEILNDEQQRLWRMLSVFPQTFDDKAAVAVWRMAGDAALDAFDDASVAVWERVLNAAQDALGDLMKWSLVEFDAETRNYRLHDLARLFAYAMLSQDERETINQRYGLYIKQFSVLCPYCSTLTLIPHLFKTGSQMACCEWCGSLIYATYMKDAGRAMFDIHFEKRID
ncbi:MAG: NB-ARC domain-containing protein [Blastocatellia bacterium]